MGINSSTCNALKLETTYVHINKGTGKIKQNFFVQCNTEIQSTGFGVKCLSSNPGCTRYWL